jgi:ribonuclease VapC
VILDSSAMIAVLLMEPGYERLLERLGSTSQIGVGAPTVTEASIVLSHKIGRDAWGLVARFLQECGAVVIPFGEDHARAALDAWSRFGKGRHAAALNYGDCMAYATAQLAGLPLLCVGADFPRTDVPLA